MSDSIARDLIEPRSEIGLPSDFLNRRRLLALERIYPCSQRRLLLSEQVSPELVFVVESEQLPTLLLERCDLLANRPRPPALGLRLELPANLGTDCCLQFFIVTDETQPEN